MTGYPILSMSPLLSRLVFVLSGLTLAVAIFAGGSSQHAMTSTALVELLSVPLLGVGFWLCLRNGPGRMIGPIAIFATGVAIGAAQLIPLPLSVWRALPGRAAVLASLTLATAAPNFLPASLDPGGTSRALASLLPGAAIFLGVGALGESHRRLLIWLLLGMGALSALVGIAQATGAIRSFYTVTNPGLAVGFFANRNHFAAVMYCLLPFAAALAVPRRGFAGQPRRWASGSVLGAGAMGALFLLGLAACGSRAGLALGLVALLGCGAIVLRARSEADRKGNWAPRIVVIAAIAALALLQFTRVGLLGNTRLGAVDEGRSAITMTTLRAAQAYTPLGTGLGAFVPIYAAAEPVGSLSSEYINHAHDDWAELWLEGGLPMAAVVGVFLSWLALAAREVWKPAASMAEISAARAATIALGLLLVHSAVDYPLRTAAISVLFALSCALLTPQGRATARAPAQAGRRMRASHRGREGLPGRESTA